MLTIKSTLFDNKDTRERLSSEKVTTQQLMSQHRKIFKIIQNLHELVCRGTKDSQKAL